MQIQFDNQKKYRKIFKEDLFGQAFLQNICLRPSCHACAFKKVNRISDLTLGDFWGNAGTMKEDDTGISLVLVHSPKGERLLSEVRTACEIQEVPVQKALKGNTPVSESVKANPNREAFFAELDQLPVEELLKKYVSGKLSAKLRVKFTLKKLGLL